MRPSPSDLTPVPRHWERPSFASLRPAELVAWVAPEVPEIAYRVVAEALEGAGFRLRRSSSIPTAARVRLLTEPEAAPAQGYRLELSENGIELSAPEPAGLYYGARTLERWIELTASESVVLPVRIEDAPAFAQRGLLLDVSRNRVPTMKTLFELVDRMASLQLNQLQLYTEHTFAYEGHETVWRDASPLTGDEIRELGAYCRERFIELVPNQNSFGHFHRWLKHDRYRRLAECPGGVRHPFGDEVEPFSLCPTDPASLELLRDLYAQLLPNFDSGLFNVGLDETFDLGQGRSREACEGHGRGRVYLDFLTAVHRLAAEHGRRIQFWGDVILKHPGLIAELPADAVALAWGYEADHPFAEELQAFRNAGLEFYVCPGTSSWNSLGGRPGNAVANLASAARTGLAAGAAGYLITDWGDFGHLQPLPVSYPGLLTGAAYAWNPKSAADDPEEFALADRLDRWLASGDREEPARTGSIGRTLCDLGEVHRLTGSQPKNGSALFFLLLSIGEGLDQPRFSGLTESGLAAARSELQRLAEETASVGRDVDSLLRDELTWVVDALSAACDLGAARLALGAIRPAAELASSVKQGLAKRFGSLAQRLPDLWLARCRRGGLPDSQHYLERIRRTLS